MGVDEAEYVILSSSDSYSCSTERVISACGPPGKRLIWLLRSHQDLLPVVTAIAVIPLV